MLYPVWAYVQLLLVFGVGFNLVRDSVGIPVAIIFSAIIFGFFHWGNTLLFFSSVFVGILWSLIFLKAPNILPLALVHSIMAGVYYYWIEKTDRLDEVVIPIYRGLQKFSFGRHI